MPPCLGLCLLASNWFVGHCRAYGLQTLDPWHMLAVNFRTCLNPLWLLPPLPVLPPPLPAVPPQGGTLP
eukprot:3248356-Alexandrium_andersonii.AAC.1